MAFSESRTFPDTVRPTLESLGIRSMSVAEDQPAPPLTEAMKQELDRRLKEDDEFPGDVVPWEVVRQQVRDSLNRGIDGRSFMRTQDRLE